MPNLRGDACVMLTPFISTCYIIRETRGRSSSTAKTWVAFLDMLIENPEVILLMGMKADASDECL
eukprot:7856977-Prorocentrum_lima.AAC.1